MSGWTMDEARREEGALAAEQGGRMPEGNEMR